MSTQATFFAFRGNSWRKASREVVLSYSISNLVDINQDYTEHDAAGYKKQNLERIQCQNGILMLNYVVTVPQRKT